MSGTGWRGTCSHVVAIRRLGRLALLVVAVALGLSTGEAPTATAQDEQASSPPATATDICDRAATLTASGQFDAAATAYTAALEADPSARCAKEGLQDLRQSRVDALCERGAVLDDRDLDDKAQEAYQEALALDPGADCAEEGLEQGGTDRATGFLDDVASPAEIAAKAAEILGTYLALFGLILLAVVVFKVARRLWQPSLEIQPFGDDATDTRQIGPLLAAMVQTRFLNDVDLARRKSAAGNVSSPADLVTAPQDLGAALEKLGTAIPAATVIAGIVSFVERVWRLPRFTVSGETQPDADEALGLSVVLAHSGRLKDGTDIWEDDEIPLPHPDAIDGTDSEGHYWLVEATSAWIEFRLTPALNPAIQTATDDWPSYLLTLAGAERVLANDLSGGQALFDKALQIDRFNTGAQANIALIRLRRKDYGSAIEAFEAVLKQRRRDDGAR